MFEVMILAIALSMDAFAVSVGLGAKSKQQFISLAMVSALYFGAFQALMPLIGYLGGKGLFGWLEGYSHWIAFGLLVWIGGKMLYEAAQDDEKVLKGRITTKSMLLLSIATSIDAMAAGFTLNLLTINAYQACLMIGATTAIFSYIGVCVGAKMGTYLEQKAEYLGGTILVLIGIKVLLMQ